MLKYRLENDFKWFLLNNFILIFTSFHVKYIFNSVSQCQNKQSIHNTKLTSMMSLRNYKSTSLNSKNS